MTKQQKKRSAKFVTFVKRINQHAKIEVTVSVEQIWDKPIRFRK